MAQDTNAVSSGRLPPEEELSLEQQLQPLLLRDNTSLPVDQLLPITGVQLAPHYDDISRDDDNTPSIGQFIAF